MDFLNFMMDVFFAWFFMWGSYLAGKGSGEEVTAPDGKFAWAAFYLFLSFFFFFGSLLFAWTALEFMKMPL